MSIAEQISRLKTAKADIKAALESKGVTVGDGTIDTYAEKISEISVGGDYEQGYKDGVDSVPQWDRWMRTGTLSSLNMFDAPVVEINLDRWGSTSFLNFLSISIEEYVNTTVEHLIINAPIVATSIQQMFYCSKNDCRDYKLKHITLNFSTADCTSWQNSFTMCRALEIIDGEPFDFSSAAIALTTIFSGVSTLREFRVVPNTLKVSITLKDCSNLSNETKESVFDGLATVSTAQTLTLHANVKILQSQVDSANAKGWTVAGGTVVSEEEYYG